MCLLFQAEQISGEYYQTRSSSCRSAEAGVAAAAGGWGGSTAAGCCSTAGTGRMKER
jgi:hypothetical protein